MLEKKTFPPTHTHDVVFGTCTRLLPAILFLLAAITTVYNFLGMGIDCLHQSSMRGFSRSTLNNWCRTIGVTSKTSSGRNMDNLIPHPGVQPYSEDDEEVEEPSAFFAMMPMIFAVQGLACYAPVLLWRIFEGRSLSCIVMGYHKASSEAERSKCATKLANHLRNSSNKLYFIKYIVCYVGSLAALFTALMVTEGFLYRELLDKDSSDQVHQPDPVMFPSQGKCVIEIYQPSGTFEIISTRCILSGNKIYVSLIVILNRMYLIAGIVTVLSLVYLMALVFVPAFRASYLVSTAAIEDKNVQHRLKATVSFDQFFMLYLISNNVDTFFFTSVLESMAQDKNVIGFEPM